MMLDSEIVLPMMPPGQTLIGHFFCTQYEVTAGMQMDRECADRDRGEDDGEASLVTGS